MIIHDRLRNMTVILLTMAALLFSFPENRTVFIIAVSVTSFCGVYVLLLLMFKRSLVKLFNILAMSLLLGYSFGSIFFVFVNVYYGSEFYDSNSIANINYGKHDLSLALLVVIIVCILLFELSRFEKPIKYKIDEGINHKGKGVGICILIGTILVIVAHLTNQIGFLGVRASDAGNIGALGALAFLIIPPLLPITACEIGKKHSFKYKIVLIIAFIVFLFASIIFGRRIFLYSLVTVFIGLSVSGFNLVEFLKKRWIVVGVFIVSLPLFVYLSFLMFYAMRIAGYSEGNYGSLLNLVLIAIDIIYRDPISILADLSSNIVERSFILSYFAGLLSAQIDYSPLFGKEMYYAFQIAIPTLFYPEKMTFLPKMPEEFIHPAIGLPIFDGNNTIITAGFNDFGFIGAIVYPILLVVVFIAYLDIAYKYLPYGLFLFVLYRFVFQLLFIEEALGGMIAICLRDLTVVVALFFVLSGSIKLLLNVFSLDKTGIVFK